MPIVIESVTINDYLEWILNKTKTNKELETNEEVVGWFQFSKIIITKCFLR